MRLAVLLYGDTDNPQGLPAAWPAEVIELKQGDPDPVAPWKEMWLWELPVYKRDHQAEYDAWLASQPAPGPGDDTLL